MFQYGLNESEPNNFKRLLSAESRLCIPEKLGATGYIFYVPSNCVYLLDSCYLLFSSKAAAGNRLVCATVYDASGHIIWRISSPSLQPANKDYEYIFLRDGAVSPVVANFINIHLPSIPLFPGCYISMGPVVFFGHDVSSDCFFMGRLLSLNK